VMAVDFQLQGQDFNAINGGPQLKFTEAISLLVNCQSQEEVDDLWENLIDDGEPGPCGWLRDRYGLSWQIVPAALNEMLSDPDPAKSQPVMEAMLKMSKIDLAQLRRAYAITPQRPPDVGRVSEPLREVDRSAEAAAEDGGEPGDLRLQCLAR